MTRNFLVLYRSILKAHVRSLPVNLKDLGDSYVKTEFRLHKNVQSQKERDQFFEAWEGYLKDLNLRGSQVGRDLKHTELLSLNEDQKKKLIEMKESSINVDR
jgi:hypothetical protein